ncbi:MAG: spore germination protein, partial [Ruminococcaceae bacterium]|nr:spore germination protein [Oscillospiraceae bacterium]
MEKHLYKEMDRNIAEIKGFFDKSVDYFEKEISLLGHRAVLVMCEDLTNITNLWQVNLRPLNNMKADFTADEIYDYISKQTTIPFNSSPAETFDKVLFFLTAGFSIIIIDGVDKALVAATQGYPARSISAPESEGSLRGTRESFCDTGRKNMALIRRRIRSKGLVIETMQIGKATKTEVSIYYHKDYYNKKVLEKVKNRLNGIDIPTITETGMLTPFVDTTKGSLFSAVAYTEKPDIFSAKLCEGKIGIIADGCPFAIIYPFLFTEHFYTSDDYSQRPYFVSFLKSIRYAAFLISIMLPGLYIALADFAPENLPQKLIFFIYSSKHSTPLPLFAEAIIIVVTLEIIKEAGLRLPKAIGHTVSFVAALIIGDSAVNAGLIGAAVLIVCAVSTIMSFVIPSFYEAVITLRIIFLLASGIFGAVGFSFGCVFLMLNIVKVNAEVNSYIPSDILNNKKQITDIIFKSSWRTINKREKTDD